jgi:FXSXX-COOH protein
MDGHIEPPAGLPERSDLPELSKVPDLPDLPEPSELPDLTELSLAELGAIQHPLLQEVLTDLRDRARRPSEMLWGWNSSF